MRAILLIIMCAVSLHTYTQETNIISLVTSPGSFDDGFSIGAQFEHRNRTIYVGPEIYYFPNLNNLDYLHAIGRIGLNAHLDRWDEFRVFGGIRLGLIARANNAHALIGGEAGIDYTFPNSKIFIGLSVAIDSKADSQAYSAVENHTVNSGLFRIGFKL